MVVVQLLVCYILLISNTKSLYSYYPFFLPHSISTLFWATISNNEKHCINLSKWWKSLLACLAIQCSCLLSGVESLQLRPRRRTRCLRRYAAAFPNPSPPPPRSRRRRRPRHEFLCSVGFATPSCWGLANERCRSFSSKPKAGCEEVFVFGFRILRYRLDCIWFKWGRSTPVRWAASIWPKKAWRKSGLQRKKKVG